MGQRHAQKQIGKERCRLPEVSRTLSIEDVEWRGIIAEQIIVDPIVHTIVRRSHAKTRAISAPASTPFYAERS